jgi:hypothetical protein
MYLNFALLGSVAAILKQPQLGEQQVMVSSSGEPKEAATA